MKCTRLELLLLSMLAAKPDGASLGELRASFEGQPVTTVLERLVERRQVRRFEGCVYGIAPQGRSRIAPVAAC